MDDSIAGEFKTSANRCKLKEDVMSGEEVKHQRQELMEQDFLDEMIEESTKRNPEFPVLMEEARQRRALLHDLVTLRTRARISRKTLAKCLKMSQSALADLEIDSVDPHLSTVQRYAAGIGKRLEWRLVDAPSLENVQTEVSSVSSGRAQGQPERIQQDSLPSEETNSLV
jgi:transcriptional regulator with XRE-family HTH domain